MPAMPLSLTLPHHKEWEIMIPRKRHKRRGDDSSVLHKLQPQLNLRQEISWLAATKTDGIINDE